MSNNTHVHVDTTNAPTTTMTDINGNPIRVQDVETKTKNDGSIVQTGVVKDRDGKVVENVQVKQYDRELNTQPNDHEPRGARTHSDDIPRGGARTHNKDDPPAGHHSPKGKRKGGSKSPRKQKDKDRKDAENTTVTRTSTLAPEEGRHETTNLVNIATNLKEGELPSNAEIQTELIETRAYLDERERVAQTTQEAQVLRDVRNLVAGVEVTLLEKNQGNLFQKFLADCTLVSEKTNLSNKANLQNEIPNTFGSLRTIITSMIKTTEFRRSFVDLFGLFKELFIDPNAPDQSIRDRLQAGESKGDVARQHVLEPLQNANIMQQEIPEAKKREALRHLRVIFESLGGHPETQNAYRGLISLWGYLNDEYYVQLDQSYTSDPDVVRLQSEAQMLIEAYTGGRTLDAFLIFLRRVVAKINRDPEFSAYLKTVRVYFEDSLDHPEKIETEEGYQRASELINRGNFFHQKYMYDEDFNNLWTESNILIDLMRNDPHVNMLQDRVAAVASDLTYRDEEGNKKVNTDLVGMLRAEFIPFILQRIREVPIKGFEIQNPDFEYLRVDDMFIQVEDILPDNIRIHTENSTDITVEDLRAPMQSNSYIHFKLDGIRPKVKDFYFAYRRAKGILAKEDEGRANFNVTGAGIKIDLRYNLVMDDQHAHLGDHTTDLTIDNLEIQILEAKKHKFLLNLGTSMFKGRIQQKLETAIRDKIDQKADDLANLLNTKVLNNMSLSKLKGIAGIAKPE